MEDELPIKDISCLFSDKKDWAPAIHSRLSGYNVRFSDFEEIDLYKFQLIIPLSLSDQRYIHRISPSPKKLHALIPSESCIDLCDNKVEFCGFLQRLGLGNTVPGTGDGVSFPYILKPKIGEWGMNIEIIRNAGDEIQNLEKINSNEFLKQKYIAGGEEFTSHIIMSGSKIVFLKTLRFEFETDFYVKGIHKAPIETREVNHTCFKGVFERILSSMGYQGICCFNYKVISGHLYIFEMNPRYGASMTEFIEEALPIYARAVYGM